MGKEVHGIGKNQTQLSNNHFYFHFQNDYSNNKVNIKTLISSKFGLSDWVTLSYFPSYIFPDFWRFLPKLHNIYYTLIQHTCHLSMSYSHFPLGVKCLKTSVSIGPHLFPKWLQSATDSTTTLPEYSLSRALNISSLCTQLLSCVQFLVTPWTVVCQAPLSMKFFKQEYWSELPFPLPGNPPKPGIETSSPMSPGLAGGFFTTAPTGKLKYLLIVIAIPFFPSTYLTGLFLPAPNSLLASNMQLLLDCTTLPEYWQKSRIQSL